MQRETFTYLLQQPEKIDSHHINELETVVKAYPYMQAARALYLKGLKNKQSFKYNQQLKTTAAYSTDRSVLFDFITSEVFNQNEISETIKRNSEHIKNIAVFDVQDISVNNSVTIDNALKQHIKASEPTIDPYLFEIKPETSIETTSTTAKISLNEASPETNLELGKPLEFDKNEKHSFSEWLKLTALKPIERGDSSSAKNELEGKAPLDEKLPIIDKFLSSNPKIEASKDAPIKSISVSTNNTYEGLMTETLARVYLEQKNYDKALQSYKILSLKYPEKSGFFADQIKRIKILQEKNNI
jgi:alpha-glucosidase (family GH31 glycosyl hydrolase)